MNNSRREFLVACAATAMACAIGDQSSTIHAAPPDVVHDWKMILKNLDQATEEQIQSLRDRWPPAVGEDQHLGVFINDPFGIIPINRPKVIGVGRLARN